MTFDDAELTTDEDLSQWEAKMPALAVRGNVLTGKRLLAKNFIAKQLLKGGIDPVTLSDPGQLKDAACFKELELIFRDLSDKPDSISGQKAEYYSNLFTDEMELVMLKVLPDGETISPTVNGLPLYRA